MLVFLHGRGEDETSYLVEPMFEALGREGGKAPVVAFPEGDPDSYWHDRDSGEWGSYVSEELIPELVERFEIEPERVAIGGISMGGFGAYDIARLDPRRCSARSAATRPRSGRAARTPRRAPSTTTTTSTATT